MCRGAFWPANIGLLGRQPGSAGGLDLISYIYQAIWEEL